MHKSKTVFLLRAFGDFVIAIYAAVHNTVKEPVTLVASKHLEPLYNALAARLPENITLVFEDFKISHNIFSCFTNRYLFSMGAIKELLALRGYIKQRSSPGTRYYLENRKRRILPGLFSGSLFAFVFSDENAYEAYADFFAVHPGAMDYPATPEKQSGLRILLIADARQKERNLDDGVIKKIADYYKEGGNSVTTAFFRQRKPSVTNEVEVYGDFQTLVALIKRYDIIVGADSMPVHLAQFFRKPHYILHPSHVKDQFFTPFSMKNKTHFTFEEIASRNSFLPDA